MIESLFYWVSEWFCFAFIWLLECFAIQSPTIATWQRVFADLGSISAIGFALTFLRGKRTDADSKYRIIGSLALIFGLFLLWEVGVGLYLGRVSRNGNELWISRTLSLLLAPSQVLAVVADSSIALAFFFRYGISAFPVIVSCVLYAALQHPAYMSLFIEPSANVRIALAAGKVLLGSTFYGLFFQPAINYDRLNIPVPKALPDSAGVFKSTAFLLLPMVASWIIFGLFTPSSSWSGHLRSAGSFLGALLVTLLISEVVKSRLSAERQEKDNDEDRKTSGTAAGVS